MEGCPTNHILYTNNVKVKGIQSVVHLVHFKNDNSKGLQQLPTSKGTLQVLVLLEQASAFMNDKLPGGVSTLFHYNNGKSSGKPYLASYFSTVAANQLSNSNVRLTANSFRHYFSTAWRDFISTPSTQLLGFTAQQLENMAASMMLNSPEAWTISYDDSTMARGMHTILALWPKFLTFVHEQHIVKEAEEPWDPLTASLAELSLE